MKLCSLCKRPFTMKQLAEKKKQKSESAKKAIQNLKARGEHVGRPRAIDYNAIQKERAAGLSIRKIAMKLKCTTGSVQRALKSNQ